MLNHYHVSLKTACELEPEDIFVLNFCAYFCIFGEFDVLFDNFRKIFCQFFFGNNNISWFKITKIWSFANLDSQYVKFYINELEPNDTDFAVFSSMKYRVRSVSLKNQHNFYDFKLNSCQWRVMTLGYYSYQRIIFDIVKKANINEIAWVFEVLTTSYSKCVMNDVIFRNKIFRTFFLYVVLIAVGGAQNSTHKFVFFILIYSMSRFVFFQFA